jgi:uncharacterized protein (TIGR02001 family)
MKRQKSRLVRTLLFFACLFTSLVFTQQALAEDSSSSQSSAKIFGEFSLTTNYIEQGVSSSNNSFAMLPVVGYLWSHAQLGIMGSNVQFPDNAESLNLRPFGWYDFTFSAGVDLKVRYDMNMYFASSSRNGNLYTLDLNISTHHIILQENTNWYGTSSMGYWLAYAHDWKAFWDLDYKVELGYELLNTPSYNSYFAGKAGFGYKYSDFNFALMASANSNSSQFLNNTGNPTVFFQVTTRF